MTVDIIISALALMLIFEGLGPLLFPNRWRNFMLQIANEKPNSIRQIGAVLVAIGAIIWLLNT
ncbi:DUF2065 domain-containing protein [Thalassotalea maritima]|uniref:DUF2065 domain-containing protein n=1 Tax=Thalassotalea maritima TaxID=3242416 RepID=UPI0035298079